MVNGTFTNNGFLIVADTELDDRFNYRTSDASAAAKRPKLVIQYTLPQGKAPSNGFAFVNYIVPRSLQQSGLLSFTPADDAYIANDFPTTNYGSATTLQVDNSPIEHFLLKFDVTSINGQTVTNLTSLITADGTYCLRIADSQGSADYSSKEGANPAQQVITLGGTA